MKNFLLATILGAATLLPFQKPADAAWDAGIKLHNECHEELYVEAQWYDVRDQKTRWWSGYISHESWAVQPDFYIYGAYDLYIYAESANFTWYTEYIHTEHYDEWNYTFTCY